MKDSVIPDKAQLRSGIVLRKEHWIRNGVIPAQAGIHKHDVCQKALDPISYILHFWRIWISTPPARSFGSAFAGMTEVVQMLDLSPNPGFRSAAPG